MEVETIILGAGADVVKFADSATNNGVDTITGFKAGSGGDKLDVSAFLSSVATLQSVSSATSGTGDITVASGNVVVLSGDAASATKLKFSANSTNLVILNATDNKVYLYTTTGTSEVDATDVLTASNQVATLTGVTATELVDANFIGTAP